MLTDDISYTVIGKGDDMSANIALAELLAAKFCHDISGPVGAINNGIEFLAEDSFAMKDQALDLLQASAKEASARLQYFRQAYGVVNGKGEANLDQIRLLVENYFVWNKKLTLDWPNEMTGASPVPLTHKMVRIKMNMLVIVSSSLLYGGKLSVRLIREEAEDVIEIKGSGKAVKIEEETRLCLVGSGDTIPLTPRNVQPYYTYLLAQEIGVALALSYNDTTIALRASLKR
ncbi:MAG: hypothetical protein K0R63_1619 [Rickettsiales bacterium]|jgi:histidine phosphotransferase ChpT|nr:hypothetical protein [Rickettsiales bacterium]